MEAPSLKTVALVALGAVLLWWFMRPTEDYYGDYEDGDYEEGPDQNDYDNEQPGDYEEGFAQGGAMEALGGNAMTTSVNMLPKPAGPMLETANDWAEFSPDAITGQNFLQAPRFIAVDTIGSSKKNVSYDIRQDIVVPKNQLSPWNNSTIDQDLTRKVLDI
jgi:hypothetical protein